MCRPASIVLTENEAYWSMLSDSHESIISENGLKDDPRLILRVEVFPASGRYDSPVESWGYKVDQDEVPTWAGDAEPRARRAALAWQRARVFTSGHHEVIKATVWLYDNSRAELHDNSRAELYDNSRAELYDTSRAELYDNSRAGLHGTSRAELHDTSSAGLYDTSRAELYDNSRAGLHGTSRAGLYDNSSAGLYGTSRAELYDNTVARKFSKNAITTLTGCAVRIDYTDDKPIVTIAS